MRLAPITPIDLPGRPAPRCICGRGIAHFGIGSDWMCLGCWKERPAITAAAIQEPRPPIAAAAPPPPRRATPKPVRAVSAAQNALF